MRELVELAFGRLGLDWRPYVKLDQRFVRPAEVDLLQADSSRARHELGWTPTMDFARLVHLMVDADLERLGQRR